MIAEELIALLRLKTDKHSFDAGEKVLHKLKHVAAEIFAFEAVKKAAEFFHGVVEGAEETAAALNKMSQQTGIGVESLQELQFAADQAHVSTEDLGTGLRFLQRNMFAAANGGKEQAKAFKKLGVEVKDGHGNLKDTDAVLGELAAKFENMADGPQKTALAMKVLGRGGAALIPLLNEGKEGIDEMKKSFRELGIELTDRQVHHLEEAEKKSKTLGVVWKGLKNQLGAELAPAFADVAQKIVKWVQANQGLIKQRLQQVAGFIRLAIEKLVSAAQALWPVMVKVTKAVGWFIDHPELLKTLLGVGAAMKAWSILAGRNLIADIVKLIVKLGALVFANEAVTASAVEAAAAEAAVGGGAAAAVGGGAAAAGGVGLLAGGAAVVGTVGGGLAAGAGLRYLLDPSSRPKHAPEVRTSDLDANRKAEYERRLAAVKAGTFNPSKNYGGGIPQPSFQTTTNITIEGSADEKTVKMIDEKIQKSQESLARTIATPVAR